MRIRFIAAKPVTTLTMSLSIASTIAIVSAKSMRDSGTAGMVESGVVLMIMRMRCMFVFLAPAGGAAAGLQLVSNCAQVAGGRGRQARL